MYSDSEFDQSDNEIEVIKFIPPNLLPDISKKRYEKAYKIFMNWREQQKNTSFGEKLLIDYFVHLISNNLKLSTLLPQYSMLRATLLQNNNVDITRFTKLKAFLKRHSCSYQPKAIKIFTSEEIDKFITEAPDDDYLVIKVALIMGVLGACRRHELYKMRTTHFNDLGTVVLVTVPNHKTKLVRNFTISGRFYQLYKKYTQLRPRTTNGLWFFHNYQKGKCSTQRIGFNKFGTMGRQIANYLGLPKSELYTGHCFRKSSTNRIVGREGDVTSLKRFCSGLQYGIVRSFNDEFITNKTLDNIERPSCKVENLELHDNGSTPAAFDESNYRERELEREERWMRLEERQFDLDLQRLELAEEKIEMEREKLELEMKQLEARVTRNRR